MKLYGKLVNLDKIILFVCYINSLK